MECFGYLILVAFRTTPAGYRLKGRPPGFLEVAAAFKSISKVELEDRGAMVRHFKKLARYLEGKDLAKRIEEDSSWFGAE